MKIDIDKMNEEPLDTNETYFLTREHAIEQIRNLSNVSCLISGYRGVGKTTLVHSIENIMTKDKSSDLFVYQNIDKYENYSLLLRKIIRGIFLEISTDERFESFRRDNLDLYDKIGDLHQHTFYEVNKSTRMLENLNKKKYAKTSISMDKLIKKNVPAIFVVLSSLNLRYDFIFNNSLIFFIFSIVWFAIKNFELGFEISNTTSEMFEDERKLLYDDEIAEYHLENILKQLQLAGVKVFFVFDEIDKISDPNQLHKILSDIKHLILLDNSSTIVIAGQDLFYEYMLSDTQDNGLVSNLFSLKIHVPLITRENIEAFIRSYFQDVQVDNPRILTLYIDSLTLKSRRIVRNLKNCISNELFWENGTPYIEINEKNIKEFETDSKLLNIIDSIEKNNIRKFNFEEGLIDLFVYHLFLWVKKMKLKDVYTFKRGEIFTKRDEEIQKYPYWCIEQLEQFLTILLEQLQENKLIELTIGEDEDLSFAWNKDVQLTSNTDREMQTKFFNDFVGLEILIRGIYTDVIDYNKKNFGMNIMLPALLKEKVISKGLYNKIKDAYYKRNKIVHGEYLSEDEISDIKLFLDQNRYLQYQLYEEYILYCIKKLGLTEYEIVFPSDRSSVQVDLILRSENYSNVLFEIKITDHVSIHLVEKLENVLRKYNEITKKKNKLILLLFRNKENTLEVVPKNKEYDVFCKTFLHNIAKKKYTPVRLKFFSDYFGLDRAFLSRKLSPVKLKMCA